MSQPQFVQNIAIILIGPNLQPALVSINPVMEIMQNNTLINSIIVQLLTTLTVLVMGFINANLFILALNFALVKNKLS